MNNTQQHPHHNNAADANRGRSDSTSTGGGFSLMNSLKGGASSSVSGNNSDAGSTARLREGLNSSNSVKSPSHRQHNIRSPPSPSMAPHAAPHPMVRTSNSFNSYQQHKQQLMQQQQQQAQHHQRRSANYRHAPKKTFSPKHGTSHHRRTESGGGGSSTSRPWSNVGLSPANSMDSEDQLSYRGGGSSIHTAVTSPVVNNNNAAAVTSPGSAASAAAAMGLDKTTSFEDCYSPATPGYNDAFSLLQGAKAKEGGDRNGNDGPPPPTIQQMSNGATPSPRISSGRHFFPSSGGSPHRNKNMMSNVKESAVGSPPKPPTSPSRQKNSTQAVAHQQKLVAPNNTPAGNGTAAGSLRKKPPTPLFTNSNNNTDSSGRSKHSNSAMIISPHHHPSSTPPKAVLPGRSSMPPPPSGSKNKETAKSLQASSSVQHQEASASNTTTNNTAARAASPMRHASPLSASRMKQSLANKFGRGNKKSGHARGGNTRYTSPLTGGKGGGSGRGGSGNYSDAVAKALQEEGQDGIGQKVDIMVRPPRSSGGRSGDALSGRGSKDEIEVISGPSTPGSSRRGGGGSASNKRMASRGGGLRVRNRSPSPVRRDLVGGLPDTSASAKSLASGGSFDNTDDGGEHSPKNNDKANADPTLHMERDSTASTPSFFGGRGIRSMSPGRVKRSLKKRLAMPSSSSANKPPQSHLPPSPEKPSLPLYPASSESGTTASHKGSVEDDDDYDQPGIDQMVPTLAHTTMSFDVDDISPRSAGRRGGADESNGLVSSQPHSQSQPTMEENDVNDEGYFINTTSFNIFESHQFLRAMGGSASEASLATNYIRTGDSLCGRDAEKEDFERAVQVYYAGLGVILTRVRDWSLEERGVEAAKTAEGDIEVEATPDTSHVLYKDFLEVAYCPETNILLLAMSAILLRAGNAHFRLQHYEIACRDYVSAQSYRRLRNEAKDIVAEERKEFSNVHVEDAKLNGRISNNMASAQSKRGMYEEARSEYTKALQIKQGTLEALHRASSSNSSISPRKSGKKDIDDKNLVSDIASTFHNIGLLRMNCGGEPKKAEKAYKQSLSLRVKKFGLDDLGVSYTLSALGDLYYRQRQFDDAFRSYKESLRIWKSHSRSSPHRKSADLKTAEHYYNIGLVFYEKGPFAKAKTSVMECLRIRRQLAKESLLVASALYLLGLIARSMGNYDEALMLLEESLDIRERLLESNDHLLVLNGQLALGTVYHKKNELSDAMHCFSATLTGRSQRLGKDNISVSEVLQAIGDTYTAANEYHKAYNTLEEALRIRRKSLGPSLEVAETLNSMSLIQFKSGDSEKAIELSEEAMEMLKKTVGFDHFILCRLLKNAGDCYQDLEAYDDAMEAYSESQRVMTAFYGREHIFLAEVLNEIGVTRFKNGEYMVAKQSFTEALRLMRLTQNEANKSAIYPTLNHLGHALYKSNELKLAAETYIESFNVQVSIVTGVANDGLKEFGTKLNSIKEKIDTMEQEEEDVSDLSESLGGIASILRYLGLVIQEQGDIEAALSANKLSLSVRLCQPFKEHSHIALMAETIAMFEYKRNNHESAMDYFNQALEAKKSSQGEFSIDVARTVNNLANIHFSLGNLNDAMELYQEALKIKRHCLGDDSDEVANTLNNIAHVMVNAGKEQEALKAYHNVLKIRQDRYGKSHVLVAATLASMGDVYIKLGKLEIAMTYFEQCIRIQKHQQIQCDERVLENLGSIYGKLGEWHKAELTFKDIIELKRAAHGDECLDVAKTLDLLAVSFIEQDQYTESIEHLQEALRIRKACLDGDDDEILASLNKLAFVYKSLDMTDQMLEVRGEFEAIQARRRNSS